MKLLYLLLFVLTIKKSFSVIISEDAFPFIEVYGYKSYDNKTNILADIFNNAGVTLYKFHKNHSFVLLFNTSQNVTTSSIKDIQKYYKTIFDYLKSFGVYFGVVHCCEEINEFCMDKSPSMLYYSFRKDVPLTGFIFNHKNSGNVEDVVIDLMETSQIDTLFITNEENFMESRIDAKDKIPILFGRISRRDKHYPIFLEIASLLKESFLTVANESITSNMDIRTVRVIDPRRCNSNVTDKCVTMELPIDKLGNIHPRQFTCQIVRSFFQNKHLINGRRSSSKPFPTIFQLLLNQCPYSLLLVYPSSVRLDTSIPYIDEKDLNILAAKLDQMFSHHPGFLLLTINRDHLFRIEDDASHSVLQSTLVFRSSISKEMVPFSGEFNDLDKIISFIKDHIAITSLQADRTSMARSLFKNEYLSLGHFFYSDTTELNELLYTAKMDTESSSSKSLPIDGPEQFMATLDQYQVVAVFFYVEWNPSSLASLMIMQQAASTQLPDDSVRITEVNCFATNTLCRDAGVVNYPALILYRGTKDSRLRGSGVDHAFKLSSGHSRSVEVMATFKNQDYTQRNIIRFLTLMTKPNVLAVTTCDQFIHYMDNLLPLLEHVIIGVNLEDNETLSAMFTKTAEALRGEEAFVTSQKDCLPQSILKDVHDGSSSYSNIISFASHALPSVHPMFSYNNLSEMIEFTRMAKYHRFFKLTPYNLVQVRQKMHHIVILFVHDEPPSDWRDAMAHLVPFYAPNGTAISWMDMSTKSAKEIYLLYKCQQSPCLVLVNLESGSVTPYTSTNEVSISISLKSWLDSALKDAFPSIYSLSQSPVAQPGLAVDCTPDVYDSLSQSPDDVTPISMPIMPESKADEMISKPIHSEL